MILLYVTAGQLTLYECSYRGIFYVDQFDENSEGVQRLLKVLEISLKKQSISIITDMYDDFVSCMALPQVSSSQQQKILPTLLTKNAGNLLCYTGYLSKAKMRAEARLFGAGKSFEHTIWYPLFESGEIPVARLFCSVVLAELALKKPLSRYSRVLICLSVACTGLRFLYFEHKELVFTRAALCDITSNDSIRAQIVVTHDYLESRGRDNQNSEALRIIIPIESADHEQLEYREVTLAKVMGNHVGAGALGSNALVSNDRESVADFATVLTEIQKELTQTSVIANIRAGYRLLKWFNFVIFLRQLKLRDCRSLLMTRHYRKHVTSLMLFVSRQATTIACLTLAVTFALFSIHGYVELRGYRQTRDTLASKLASVSDSIKIDSTRAFVMRDSVLFADVLKENTIPAVEILEKLAELMDAHNRLSLSTLLWGYDIDSLNEGTVLTADSLEATQDKPIMLRLTGFVSPGFSSKVEGYSFFEDLLHHIDKLPHFGLIEIEKTPFGNIESVARTNDVVSLKQNRFSLVLKFGAGDT